MASSLGSCATPRCALGWCRLGTKVFSAKKVETPGQPCRALLSRRIKAKFSEEVCESQVKTGRFPQPEGRGDQRFDGDPEYGISRPWPFSTAWALLPAGREPPAASAYFLAAFFAPFLADFLATFFATFFFAAFFLATVLPPNKLDLE